jgi:hypothetical protein
LSLSISQMDDFRRELRISAARRPNLPAPAMNTASFGKVGLAFSPNMIGGLSGDGGTLRFRVEVGGGKPKKKETLNTNPEPLAPQAKRPSNLKRDAKRSKDG